jgi:hypothetical protein
MIDQGYIEWLAREGRDEEVRAACQALLTPAPTTEQPEDAPAEGGDIPF